MVSVTLRLIHRYLPGEKECLQQLSVAGSTGLAGDNEDWWQPTNCCIRFVERQGDQMAWEVKPEKRAIPARYSSVLSELLTAHSQRGQQQGQRCTRSLADSAREEWQEKRQQRTCREFAAWRDCMWVLPLRDWEAMSESQSVSDSLFAKQSNEPLLVYITSWLGWTNGIM